MRVIQVINHAGLDRGGAERLVRMHHLDLLAQGVEARLICLEDCDLAGIEGAESLGAPRAYAPRAWATLARRLRATLRPGDIVHGHLFPGTMALAAARALRGIRRDVPVVFTEHNTSNRRRGHPVLSHLDRRLYGLYARIFCISAGTRTALVSAFPHLAPKCAVIENGADLRFAAPPARSGRAAAAPVELLSIGRLAVQKNHRAAILALAALAQAGQTHWRYTILGAGPEEAALRALIAETGQGARITLAGHVPDVGRYLEAADIFLLPSAWEGFGLVAVEAMNAGLPVVASDVAGLREVVAGVGSGNGGVRDGMSAGLLVDPENAQSVSTAIAQLLADPDLRVKMGAMGFERARGYAKEAMTARYITAYRAVLDPNAPPNPGEAP